MYKMGLLQDFRLFKDFLRNIHGTYVIKEALDHFEEKKFAVIIQILLSKRPDPNPDPNYYRIRIRIRSNLSVPDLAPQH
jgi:hypothetical protein